MISVASQILTVIVWLIIIKFCQITLSPYMKPALKNIAYGLFYPVSILVLTLFHGILVCVRFRFS